MQVGGVPAEAAENDPVRERLTGKMIGNGNNGDPGRPLRREAEHARADRREGYAGTAVCRCQSQRRGVTGGRQRVFVAAAAAPDRSHGVDDVACVQLVPAGDPCLAGGTTAQPAALVQQSGAGGTVNGAIDPAAAQQRFVRRVDDRVHRERGYVALDDFHPRFQRFLPFTAGVLAVLLALAGASRPARTDERLPVWIYREAGLTDNRIAWTNVIPAGAALTVNPAFREDPRAEATVLRLSINLQPTGWAGIVASTAPGYWGAEPGPALDLREASALAFRAKGAAGGERIRVRVAVISDAAYGDSAPLPFDTGWITLTADWQEYRLAVDGRQLSRVVTPFALIANRQHNPSGQLTVLLDDIRFLR